MPNINGLKFFGFLFLLPMLAFSSWSAGDRTAYRRTLGLGVAYNGVLVRVGFQNHWAIETHFMSGSAPSTDGNVTASLIGVRGYRHFQTERRLQFFVGPEIARITTKSENLKSAGYLAGAFAGLDYYLTRRLGLGVDFGPYYISLKEDATQISNSGVDMIFNTHLNFYFL